MWPFKKKKQQPVVAHWNIFNAWEKYEFAECSNCGHEEDATLPIYDFEYPAICPNCKAKMGRMDIISQQ